MVFRLQNNGIFMELEKIAIESPEGVQIKVFIQPRSTKTQFQGQYGDEIKLRVASSPVEGKANEEICRYLAKEFGVPQRTVEMVSGARSRHKRVLLKGKTLSDLKPHLTKVLKSETS